MRVPSRLTATLRISTVAPFPCLLMSMFYDIYGLSSERNAPTVERFLSQFCDRYALDPLSDTWLQVAASESYQVPEVELPVASIADLIDYAVQNPTHCFVFYNQQALRPDITCVFFKFTYDGKVVFGVSIEETGFNLEDNFPHALTIEAEIVRLTGAYKSFIAVEQPPAQDEAQFDVDSAVWQSTRDEFN
jgi:hypothetical protein